MAKKNNIAVDVINGNKKPEATKVVKVDAETSKRVERGSKATKVVTKGLLISRNSHPVSIAYGEDTINLSPRQRVEVDLNLLPEKLPLGVVKKAH